MSFETENPLGEKEADDQVPSVRQRRERLRLESCLEEALSLERLRAILGLTDAESTSVYQAAAGPLFRTAVEKAVDGELGQAQKAELDASLADLTAACYLRQSVLGPCFSEVLRACVRPCIYWDIESIICFSSWKNGNVFRK